jgi:hypothetical protein
VATIENFINAAYEANLGRPADLSGMTYYLGEIASGNKTVDQVIADIEYAGQQFSQPGQAEYIAPDATYYEPPDTSQQQYIETRIQEQQSQPQEEQQSQPQEEQTPVSGLANLDLSGLKDFSFSLSKPSPKKYNEWASTLSKPIFNSYDEVIEQINNETQPGYLTNFGGGGAGWSLGVVPKEAREKILGPGSDNEFHTLEKFGGTLTNDKLKKLFAENSGVTSPDALYAWYVDGWGLRGPIVTNTYDELMIKAGTAPEQDFFGTDNFLIENLNQIKNEFKIDQQTLEVVTQLQAADQRIKYQNALGDTNINELLANIAKTSLEAKGVLDAQTRSALDQFSQDGVALLEERRKIAAEIGKRSNSIGLVLALGSTFFAPYLGPKIGAAVGLTGTAATIGGGALLGAGISFVAGGDPIKGAVSGAIGAIGSTTYATEVGTALGIKGAAAPIVGNAVINAGLSGIAAVATGGNIGKSMLDGAIKGAALAGATEFAEAILGKDNIASLAEATGLDKKQVESIFTTSVANGVTAEVSGQGEFLETLGISLVAQGVGAKSANLMKGAMKDVLDKDPEIMASVLTATGGIATTATNAFFRGEDVGEALKNNAPGIILSSVQTYQSEADRQDEIKRKQEEAAAAQREKELGAVQQPPATGDAVEGAPAIEGEGAGEVSLGESPLQVAGDELGFETGLDLIETLEREALSGIGEEEIRREIVQDEGFTYEVKLVQGVRDDGSLYEYKIIVDQDGSVSYEWNPSFTESVASRERPDLRSSPPETAVPSDRVNLFGTTQEDLRPVAVPDEPPIVVGIDLRKYGDPSLGGGDALIRSTEGPTGFTETAGIFQFIGTEPTSGLQKYKVGNQSFTFIMLPGKQPALLNDVADIVLIPREEPSSDPTQPPKLTFDERPLEDFTPPPEDVPPPEPEDVPPPDPTKLPPGTAADRDEGASGTAGEKGAAGGLTGLEEQRRKERDATISRIVEEELSRLTSQLTQAENEAQQAAKNLQRAQEQQRKFTAPDFVAISGPDLASSLEQETQFATDAAERAEDARAAAAEGVVDIGALQRGEQTLTDEQILGYLRTGQLPPAGGEGDGEPGTRGPGTGADEEGPGTGSLDRGDGTGAGDRGTGFGAGEEGLGPGGGGTGGEGSGEVTTRLSPSLIFDRETGGRPETTPFSSRVTGEALASILGEKEPLFGGDDDEQRAVWNRRSLKLLSRALGL